MRRLRTVVALLLALSVAALPAAKTFAAVAGSQQEISSLAPDCSSHHDGSADHTSTALPDCGPMMACPGMCLNYVAPALFVVETHPLLDATDPSRDGTELLPHISDLPDRPPRV